MRLRGRNVLEVQRAVPRQRGGDGPQRLRDAVDGDDPDELDLELEEQAPDALAPPYRAADDNG